MLTVELLGRPVVRHAGAAAQPPRDRKTWALLAYLLLSEHPTSRERLAEVLFPGAHDPLAGVRWNLAQVRRLLGAEGTVGGDPVHLELAPASVVDVDVLLHGRWSEAVRLPSLGQALLAGLTVGSAPAFELWLTVARRRLRAAGAAVLQEAALAALAPVPQDAVRWAERLVEVEPYDEDHHVLLVRALTAAGRLAEAAERAEAGVALLRRELGVAPTGAVREALTPAVRRPVPVGPARAAPLPACGSGPCSTSPCPARLELLSLVGALRAALGDALAGRAPRLPAQR